MWKKIENLPEKYRNSHKMFVVKGINVVHPKGVVSYTTDPYCVWWDGDRVCGRWPHAFPPTHFCELPEDVESVGTPSRSLYNELVEGFEALKEDRE